MTEIQALPKDWVIARAALDELERYLLSSSLYWPVPGARARAGDVPRFTIGNLMLSLKRLQGVDWPPEMREELDRIQEHVTQLRERWKAHWIKKAGEEFRQRLARWQEMLNDLRKSGSPSAAEYAYQVRQRVILELLCGELEGSLAQEKSALAATDGLLRAMVQSAQFVWDEAVREAFPEKSFWFLYRLPQTS